MYKTCPRMTRTNHSDTCYYYSTRRYFRFTRKMCRLERISIPAYHSWPGSTVKLAWKNIEEPQSLKMLPWRAWASDEQAGKRRQKKFWYETNEFHAERRAAADRLLICERWSTLRTFPLRMHLCSCARIKMGPLIIRRDCEYGEILDNFISVYGIVSFWRNRFSMVCQESVSPGFTVNGRQTTRVQGLLVSIFL